MTERVAWFDRGGHESKRARRPRPPPKPKQAEMAGMETCDAAEFLTKVKRESEAKKSKNKVGEESFDFDCRRFRLPPFVRQFTLLKSEQTPRKDLKPIAKVWKFDFCWPDPALKLIVEINGGVWMPGGGAHSHPIDITRNMAKSNDAMLAGYSVLQFTPDDVKDGSAIEFTVKWLASRGWRR